MSSYKVLMSVLAGGCSLTPGSVVNDETLMKLGASAARLVKRGTLRALEEPESEVVAPPPGPLAPAGVVERPRPPEPGEEAGEEVDLTQMSREELDIEAKARGIEIKPKWKKQDVIAAIEAHAAEHAQRAGDAVHMKTQFDLDPEVMRAVPLDQLNLLLNERSAGKQGPFQTADECIAVLSRDFRGGKGK